MPAVDSIRADDELPALVKGPLTRQHLVEWCAAENDYYPLHYDERVAQTMGLAAPPVQGTLKYALMARSVERWLGDSGMVISIEAQYRGVDFEGDTLTVCGRVTAVNDDATIVLEVWIDNQRGECTTRGQAIVQLVEPAPAFERPIEFQWHDQYSRSLTVSRKLP
jgi:acyl dehydratase